MRARVYIATTEGPVLVQRLAPEEGLAEAELSAVCLDGTPTRLPITGAYTYFVRDHVRGISGDAAYRLDLDRRIDGGSSWMLGVWAAHLLLAEGRLAMGEDNADTAVFATGEMAVAADAERRVEVRAVGHVADKVARLAEKAAEEAAVGRRVLLVAPRDNAAEAESAVRRLPARVRDRVALCAVADTGEARGTLAPAGGASAAPAHAGRRRRRGGRWLAVVLVLLALLGAAGAGFVGWRNVERDWEALRLDGRYLDLARSLDDFYLPAVAERFREKWRGQRVASGFTVSVSVRRPADGNPCSGMRFRRVATVETLVTASGSVFRLDRPRSLCGFEVRAAADAAVGGHTWISVRFEGSDGARTALLPPRRLVSGRSSETPLGLSQELPLYLEDAWAWTVTAVWAPAPSKDVAPLLEAGDPAAVSALEDVGLSVVHARIELGR